MVEEIINRLSFEEMKKFLSDLAFRGDTTVRNALLSRFAHYADPGTKSLDAKYNAIFRLIQGSYKKGGFIDYYSALEFGTHVGRLLDAADDLMEQGELDEAFALLKSVLRNWIKCMGCMDDSSGVSSDILRRLSSLFSDLYRLGKTEVLDFLLDELQGEGYSDFVRETFANAISGMAILSKSPDVARRVLMFFDAFSIQDTPKLRLLAKFFPEEYKKYVHERLDDLKVVEFHFVSLMEQKRYDEALEYVELALSRGKKRSIMEMKAAVLEALSREDAIEVLWELFKETHYLSYLGRIRNLVSRERWEKIKGEAKKLLDDISLLNFLLEEGEYEEFIREVNRMKDKIGKYEYLYNWLLKKLDGLPEHVGLPLAEILMEAAPSVLGLKNTRKQYRAFLKDLDPLWGFVDADRMEEFLNGLVKRYPARAALKDEVDKYLKSRLRSRK